MTEAFFASLAMEHGIAVAGGVVVMRAGLYSNCVRLLPPLVMPEDMLREGLAVVGRAIESVCVTHVAAPA